jgi:probable HAF family extracellular repeat protein
MPASRSSGSSAPATRRLRLALALAAVLLGTAAARAQVPGFTGVGDLPGGAIESAALDVSADGLVVVGESESASGTQAFRWTPAGGMVGLGFLSGTNPYSSARAVSADGSVIAGTSRGSDGVERAFRWSGGSLTALNRFSCDSCDPVTQGWGLSSNGLVVVGSAVARSGGTSPIHLDPVRWAGGGTAISDLGNLAGPQEAGEAFGASATGSLIVGTHFSNNGKDAFRWQGSGLVALPSITGGSVVAASAFAVSDDGTTIVGTSNQSTVTLPGGTVVAAEPQAVRWTGASFGTLLQLGSLPGAAAVDSRALGVSSNGAIIVGSAADADLSQRAFIWDAAGGMRDLKTVLALDYGLDLTGWVLSEALAVSDVVAGDFSVVGRGIDPQGHPQGWLAFLSTPACRDGADDDGDLLVDYPDDPQCTSPVDWSELNDCADGIDNDGDGASDHPADPGCRSAADPTERPDCADGLDNDGDSYADHPADPGCAGPGSAQEDPACQNGLDDDADLDTDHPDDAGCTAPSDLSETADCADGLDNDGDAQTDFPSDPECESAGDASEAGQCADGADNDGDGRSDYPEQYPGCTDPDDPIEAAQCGDGVDNDGDLLSDFPDDPGCRSPAAQSEDPVTLAEGDLVAVDRASRAVFRVDTGNGAQTPISQAAQLLAPQGVGWRDGLLVVADPAGLVVVSGSGGQRLASPSLAGKDSLQLVFDAALDAYVLEAAGISRVAWNPLGIGAKSLWLAVPTPEVLSLLGNWHGDSLAIESGGDLLTSALSIFGDGVYRVDPGPPPAPGVLRPGFQDIQWLDLAVEANGTILAVGFEYDLGTGVYRVNPVSGVHTALNNSFAWQKPTGVAVDAQGEIYVADAGVCSDGSCSGGRIVNVDPVTGAATQLSSGGLIAGELDLHVIPEPAQGQSWLAGIAALAALARLRSAKAARRR